uniref:ABC transporter permease n=1 Tax=Acetatifactor sp. TaxID=1872090 RepID=UPI0040563E2C
MEEEPSPMMNSGQYEMFADMESSIMGGNSLGPENFSELMPGADGSIISTVIKDNYDVLYGNWPENYNEVILVLNANNSISAGTLYQLGLMTKEQYEEAVEKIQNGENAEELFFDYADICEQTFYLVAACDHYMEEENGTFTYIEEGELYEERLLDKAVALKITGIVRPKVDSENANISTAVAYTSKLTDYIIEHTDESPVIQAQEADTETNVLTGMEFEALSEEAKVADAKEYLGAFGISEKASFYQLMIYYASTNEENAIPVTAPGMMMDETSMASAFDIWLANSPNQEILLKVYDEYIAGATYEDNMKAFGKVSYDAPASISIYTDSFENKNAIADCIETYNAGVDEDEKIIYTDYVAMLTSSITTIIDGISYVLVAFVAISLVVSCIMIGIITHISVMERTKEIGILRALGASKRNISQVFNAETFIIGCFAGLLGIGVSILALFPINRLIEKVSGIAELDAQLPMESSLILIAISIVITMLGGLLPARKAAKKDPVIALRTE